MKRLQGIIGRIRKCFGRMLKKLEKEKGNIRMPFFAKSEGGELITGRRKDMER